MPSASTLGGSNWPPSPAVLAGKALVRTAIMASMASALVGPVPLAAAAVAPSAITIRSAVIPAALWPGIVHDSL